MTVIGDYGYVLVFFVAALAFGVGTLIISKLAAPKNSYPAKESTYECGEVPVGGAWIQFNISYYIFALIFVIFDVEAIFLFPWAVVLQTLKSMGLGMFAVVEMTVFILILVLGLAYAWRKGVLRWL
jgi:NADH:ubiquinone oxidoreductase subunit 3 (subunit A)